MSEKLRPIQVYRAGKKYWLSTLVDGEVEKEGKRWLRCIDGKLLDPKEWHLCKENVPEPEPLDEVIRKQFCRLLEIPEIYSWEAIYEVVKMMKERLK